MQELAFKFCRGHGRGPWLVTGGKKDGMRKRRWRGEEGRTLRGLLVLWALLAVVIPIAVRGVARRAGESDMVLVLGVSGRHLDEEEYVGERVK